LPGDLCESPMAACRPIVSLPVRAPASAILSANPAGDAPPMCPGSPARLAADHGPDASTYHDPPPRPGSVPDFRRSPGRRNVPGSAWPGRHLPELHHQCRIRCPCAPGRPSMSPISPQTIPWRCGPDDVFIPIPRPSPRSSPPAPWQRPHPCPPQITAVRNTAVRLVTEESGFFSP